jgi:CubicO group peptidase (beta-lactamase class C family)
MNDDIGAIIPSIEPARAGIDARRLERLYRLIESHIDRGWYPGAAIAMCRDQQLVAHREFGQARINNELGPAQEATPQTRWLLYSQTKPVVSSAIWSLVEDGLLRFHDRVADYIPEFASHGKDDITLAQVLAHEAGFPSARPGAQTWEDHALLRKAVCDFRLEWAPGTRVSYHGASAHSVQAVLMEAVTGQDYRDVVRERILDPLGLDGIQIGVPDALHDSLAGAYIGGPDGPYTLMSERNSPAFWRAGLPGGGGYASAIALCTFYQMLLRLGTLNGTRVLGPRTIQYVSRNHTAERIDEKFGMPMHRGLGVHVRGNSPQIRGLGSTAHPNTYGHGGVGTSYSWADPQTGVSFTYLTNSQLAEPLHSHRLDEVMVMAHAAVIAL